MIVSWTLGIRHFVFDREEKLTKVLNILENENFDLNEMHLFLRVATPYSDASAKMDRFGLDVTANPKKLENVLSILKNKNLQLFGVSMHIGINAKSMAAYHYCFEEVFEVFKLCMEQFAHSPKVINIGGGFDPTKLGFYYLGALALEDQIRFIGQQTHKLKEQYKGLKEVWTEMGQSYVGKSGIIAMRVEFVDFQEQPEKCVNISKPMLFGEVLWGHPVMETYCTVTQRIVSQDGDFNVGLLKYVTIFPEILELDSDGSLLKINHDELIPIQIFSKSCNSTDCLNPRVNGRHVYLLLPKLRPTSTYLLRLNYTAYLDSTGDFNWQGIRFFPVHYAIENDKNNFIVSIKEPAKNIDEKYDFEYRDRILSHGKLHPRHIAQARKIIIEQFNERETMISWLRSKKQITYSDHEAMCTAFRTEFDSCLESGISLVRLKVPHGSPDEDGEVISVILGKVLDENSIQSPPTPGMYYWERRNFRHVFEAINAILRRLKRLNAGLQEKIFPMAYLTMAATRSKSGGHIRELSKRFRLLAEGSNSIKAAGTIATGLATASLCEASKTPLLYYAKYDEISFMGEKPFAGINFRGKPGELRFYLSDFSGPQRKYEKLPENECLKINIEDLRYHIG